MILIGSRRATVLATALATGCLVAACGSAGSTSSSTSTTTAAAAAGRTGPSSARRAALVACLKSHGVTLPARAPGGGPRPGGGSGSSGGSGRSGGSGSSGASGTGTTTTPRRRGFFFGRAPNPKLQAAFKACGVNLGAGRGFRGGISRTRIASYVTCVRKHGYNLPAPNFSGKGPVFPSNIRSNSKFRAASRACQNLLVPPRGSAPPGGSGGGTSSGSGGGTSGGSGGGTSGGSGGGTSSGSGGTTAGA